jgi:SAM-dependent methyltransferase
MVHKNKVSELSPDGYSRFFFLVDILKQIYGPQAKKIRILDVGGGSEFFEQQLKKTELVFELTILDIIPRPAGIKVAYIQGDATNMELDDRSYDVVVSTDVLEHIPEKGKKAFLEECLRVAKEVCIVAGPLATDGVNDAEITVNNFNKKLFGVGQDWLEEHFLYGKPKPSLFLETLTAKHVPYDDFGTQNITTWLLNTHINLIDAKLGLDHAEHIKVNRYYDENIMQMNEFMAPTYRHFFVMYKDPSKQRAFNPRDYTDNGVNYTMVATYTNMLMGLFVQKIGQLDNSNLALTKEVQNIQKRQRLAEQENRELRLINQDQAALLKKLAPVIKVMQSRPAQATYRFLHNKNEGANNGR